MGLLFLFCITPKNPIPYLLNGNNLLPFSMEITEKVLKEAANNAAVLNCYRERLVFFTNLSARRGKRIKELENQILLLEEKLKQPV